MPDWKIHRYKVKRIIGMLLILFFFILFTSFAERKGRKQTYKSIQINIYNKDKAAFLTESDIYDIINKKGLGIIDRKRNEVDLDMLENEIVKNPFVANAEVYSDLKGILYMDVFHRIPVLRIHDNSGAYYLDKYGDMIPLSINYASNVLSFTGYLKDILRDTLFKKEIIDLAMYINKDKFLKALIGQVYIEADREILMIPRIGNFIIDFGVFGNRDIKFRKLKTVYKKILPDAGWSTYDRVILKYRDQIVLNRR
jgi:cell division protein FtsQ